MSLKSVFLLFFRKCSVCGVAGTVCKCSLFGELVWKLSSCTPVPTAAPQAAGASGGICPSPCGGSSSAVRTYSPSYENPHHSWESQRWEQNDKVTSCVSEHRKERRGKSQNTLGFVWRLLLRCCFIRCSQSHDWLHKSRRQVQTPSEWDTLFFPTADSTYSWSKHLTETSTQFLNGFSPNTSSLYFFPASADPH